MTTFTAHEDEIEYMGEEIRFVYRIISEGRYKFYSDDPKFSAIIGTGGFNHDGIGTTPYIKIENTTFEILAGLKLMFADAVLRKITVK